MISTAITPLENGGMDPLQMAANKIDAVIIFHLAIITNEAVLAFHTHAIFRDIAGDVSVVVPQVDQDVVDAPLIDFPTPIGVHLATRHLVIFEEPIRQKWSTGMDRSHPRLHPSRLVVVDAEQINLASGEQLLVTRVGHRHLVMFQQYVDQLLGIAALDRRIEERPIEEQIGNKRRFQIRRM